MSTYKFVRSYRCDCFQPHNYCTCSHKTSSIDILKKNVDDIAKSLVEVMQLCGIHIEKFEVVSHVIYYFFLHFEEIIHRIDSVPRKRLSKEDLMHDLGRKCCMNRREAQMAYSIIKRAFKAFYHGTDLGGVPNILLSSQLKHTSECIWVRAAQRTAQAYAAYQGVSYADQKYLECKIKLIYKQLYVRISIRLQPSDNHECYCKMCMKRIGKETLRLAPSATDLHEVDHPFEIVFLEEQRKQIGSVTYESLTAITNEKEKRCSCPSFEVTENDHAYRENAESTRGSSQGSFVCQWLSITKEEFEADEAPVDIKLPQEFSCSTGNLLEKCTCICRFDDETDGIETEEELASEEISVSSESTYSSISDKSSNANCHDNQN